MKKFRITWMMVALVTFAISVMFFSCEEEGKEDEEVPIQITGDSGLMIENQTCVDAKIYFDDDYIGKVKEEKTREWAVPVGNHTVKADCGHLGDVKKNAYFSEGNSVKITIFEIFGTLEIDEDY